jgi:hypothetical protein
VGLDFMQNQSFEALLKDFPKDGQSASVIGIPIGHDLQISKSLSMVTEFGFYVYKKHNLTDLFYQRYGLRNVWWKGLYTSLFLKSHKAKAECLEANVGVML